MDKWLSILGKSNEYLNFRKVNQQTEPDWTIAWKMGSLGFERLLGPIVGSGNSELPIPEILPRSVFGSKLSSRLR
jgi:hypothetical protein